MVSSSVSDYTNVKKALQSKHSEVLDLVGHHEERMRRVFAMINDTIFYT